MTFRFPLTARGTLLHQQYPTSLPTFPCSSIPYVSVSLNTLPPPTPRLLTSKRELFYISSTLQVSTPFHALHPRMSLSVSNTPSSAHVKQTVGDPKALLMTRKHTDRRLLKSDYSPETKPTCAESPVELFDFISSFRASVT